MSEGFKGFLIVGAILSIFGVFMLNTTTESETPYTEPETTSWEVDTASDEPRYYEDTDYVETMGTDDCTEDCSGHSAGWEWAEEYEICDPDYDNGNSDSFNEGVNQWTEENC